MVRGTRTQRACRPVTPKDSVPRNTGSADVACDGQEKAQNAWLNGRSSFLQ
jgi:hypothetical protein